MDRVRELVRSKSVEVIVCYGLDRLTRDPAHGVIITQELEKSAVTLETVTDSVDNSELGKMINYIREYAYKIEAEKIGERSMRGKTKHANKGEIPSGFGRYKGYLGLIYDKKTKKLSHVSGQIEIALEILNRCLDGYSISQITVDLQKRGVRGIGGEIIQRSGVSRVLHNAKVYAGVINWNGIKINGKVEPIISEEQAARIEIRLKQNQKSSQGYGKRTWVGGRVFCGLCGRRYNLDSTKGCYCNGSDRRNPTQCHSPKIPLRELSSLAYGTIIEAFSDPKRVIERVKQAHDKWEDSRKTFEEMRERRDSQNNIIDKRRRALSVQHEMNGLTDEEYARRLSDIQNEYDHSPNYDAFMEAEPPSPEKIGKISLYGDMIMLRSHFAEVLKNPRDKIADDLANNIDLKVIISPARESGHKYSAKVMVNLPIKSEESYFPDDENPSTSKAIVSLSARHEEGTYSMVSKTSL